MPEREAVILACTVLLAIPAGAQAAGSDPGDSFEERVISSARRTWAARATCPAQPISCGQTVVSSLGPGDCQEAPGQFVETWRFAGADGQFVTIDGQIGDGQAVALEGRPDSGLFWFFDEANIEMLVKVLDACASAFDSFWVFYAATTDVRFDMTVIDTQEGVMKIYLNPLGMAAAPVQDTQAFKTCS